VIDRTTRDLTNHLEQDHSGIKQRTHSVGGQEFSVGGAVLSGL